MRLMEAEVYLRLHVRLSAVCLFSEWLQPIISGVSTFETFKWPSKSYKIPVIFGPIAPIIDY